MNASPTRWHRCYVTRRGDGSGSKASWMPTALPLSIRWGGAAGSRVGRGVKKCGTRHLLLSFRLALMHNVNRHLRCDTACSGVNRHLQCEMGRCVPLCCAAENYGGRAGAALRGAAQAARGGEGAGGAQGTRVVARPHHQVCPGCLEIHLTNNELAPILATCHTNAYCAKHPCPTRLSLASSPATPCSPNSASEEKLLARKALLLQQREELSQRFEQAQARLMEARAAEDAKGGVPGAQLRRQACGGVACCLGCCVSDPPSRLLFFRVALLFSSP